MTLFIVGHRQQRERAGREEDLVGDVAVRPLVPKRRNHRHMVVFPAGDRDSRRLARRGVSPVHGGQHRRTKLSAVFERHHHSVRSALDRLRRRFPQEPEISAGLRSRLERGAEVPVFVHDPERLIVFRLERQAAGLKTVRDLDRPDRAAGHRQVIGHADRLQHPHRARRHCAGAAVEGLALAFAWVRRVDEDRGNPARIERRCERQPDQPASEDDDVRAVHEGAPYRSVALTPRHRLTGDSAKMHSTQGFGWGLNHGDRGSADP